MKKSAERKIIIVLCYYITLGVFSLIAFTLDTRDLNRDITAMFEYIEREKKMVATALVLMAYNDILFYHYYQWYY